MHRIPRLDPFAGCALSVSRVPAPASDRKVKKALRYRDGVAARSPQAMMNQSARCNPPALSR